METLVVNDFTEDDIKSAVEDYLVYFTVMVGLVPMSDKMEILFSGTYFDHLVDWD